MQYRQDIFTRICCYMQVELIAILIVTIRSIWHNSVADFYVLENFHHKFANLVAPPIDVTTNGLVPCKAHLVL